MTTQRKEPLSKVQKAMLLVADEGKAAIAKLEAYVELLEDPLLRGENEDAWCTVSEEDLGRVGRQDLLALCRHLRSELEQARKGRDEAVELARRQLVIEGCLSCRGGAEYKAMLANLTSVQERSSELLKETRVLRTALELMEKADDSAEDCVARAREIWSKP